jgi:hypothetical protein
MRMSFTHLRLIGASAVFCAALSSCSAWWFSTGIVRPDQTRPVCRIELRNQPTKLGATTAEGIVFLNAEGATGACRVHYFLGSDMIIEDGVVGELGGGYALAQIDLKTQAVPVMTRELTADDELVALVMVGRSVERIDVELADDSIAAGYALRWPGRTMPAGTGIFVVRAGQNAGDLHFAGLANGLVTVTTATGSKRYITFTGPARMREAMATPKPMFKPHKIKHRPDGISVKK